MTQLEIEDGKLHIKVEGADKLWALRSRLTIPLAHISKVEYDPQVAGGWWHGIKAPGSNVPGVLTAGTFYQHGQKVFWDVHNPDNTIILTLHDETYQKLIIEVDDPMAAENQISAALT